MIETFSIHVYDGCADPKMEIFARRKQECDMGKQAEQFIEVIEVL